MKVGLLSDTHGFIDDKLNSFFENCDEIWHAGDIGDFSVIQPLQKICKSVIAVYGNIDGMGIRQTYPEFHFLVRENLKILIIHIAGSMSIYNPLTRKLIMQYEPEVLVCGHSHILKIAYDPKFKLMYINPGAYGIHGFHQFRTAARFEIVGNQLTNMQILEVKKSSLKSLNPL